MKNSFILYTDLGPSILELKDAEVGKLTKAIYRYVMTGEVTSLRGGGKICFDVIRNHLDRDQEKYEKTCQKRAEAGRKGGLASGKRRNEATEANADDCSAKEAENENENENDNDNKNENINENGNENENKNRNENSNTNRNCARLGVDPSPTLAVLQERFPNVSLGRLEYDTLRKEFPTDYERRLKRLSDFLFSTGSVCEDPLSYIRLWAAQERNQGRQRGSFGVKETPLSRAGQI